MDYSMINLLFRQRLQLARHIAELSSGYICLVIWLSD